MTTLTLEQVLDRQLASFDRRPDTGAMAFALASPSRGWSYSWHTQGASTTHFIASVTKLYVTAILLGLRAEGRLDLDAPAARHLPPGTMAGLHVRKGVDAGERITVRQLMAQTSGIGDYFEGRRRDGSATTFEAAIANDTGWTLADVLRLTREQIPPAFDPGAPRKALYSDTGYQLLGALIEQVTGQSFEAAVRERVIDRLGLTGTWPFDASTLDRFDEVTPMLNGREPLRLPRTMASVRADGGIVSTPQDGITFLRAFFGGELFPAADIAEITAEWRAIFPPLTYGTGIMRFALPWYFSPLRRAPEMIGHSGASGTVLYRVPALDLYVAGTVNQVRSRSMPYRLLVGLVMACEDAFRRDRAAASARSQPPRT